MSHFYEATQAGVEARHFVEMASRPGELRPTRITDVRKMWKEGREVVPSVTTILNVLDKAALVNWKVDQHLQIAHKMAVEDMDRIMNQGVNLNLHSDDYLTYLSECKRRTEIEMSKAPDAGTDIHNVLENWMQGSPIADSMRPLCMNVSKALGERVADPEYSDWYCEKRFADERGFGGCADLLCYTPEPWVIDYKTKQTADKFKPGKMAYPDHSRQLAAYREGLGIPNARCANAFICIETGEVNFHEHTEEQLAKGWRVFSHALAIWQEENNYPQATQEAA